MDDSPLVEGKAGMRDSERHHVADRQRRVGRDDQVAMLVVETNHLMSRRNRNGRVHRAARSEPCQGDGRVVVGGVALAKADNRFVSTVCSRVWPRKSVNRRAKLTPRLACTTGSARPGGTGRGCRAGASAVAWGT